MKTYGLTLIAVLLVLPSMARAESTAAPAILADFFDAATQRTILASVPSDKRRLVKVIPFAQLTTYCSPVARSVGGFVNVLNAGTTELILYAEQQLVYTLAGGTSRVDRLIQVPRRVLPGATLQLGIVNAAAAAGCHGTMGYFGKVAVFGAGPIDLSGELLTSATDGSTAAHFVHVPFSLRPSDALGEPLGTGSRSASFAQSFSQCETPVSYLASRLILFNPTVQPSTLAVAAQLKYQDKDGGVQRPLTAPRVRLAANEATILSVNNPTPAVGCHSNGTFEGTISTSGSRSPIVGGLSVLVGTKYLTASRSQEFQPVPGEVR